MLSAFDYKSMWGQFKKEYKDSSVHIDQKTSLINPIYLYDLMNIFEENYIKENKKRDATPELLFKESK